MPTTFRTMDISDLGDNANAVDLAAFQRACKIRNHVEDEADEETTAWMWGDGDFLKRVALYVTYDANEAEYMAAEEQSLAAGSILADNREQP